MPKHRPAMPSSPPSPPALTLPAPAAAARRRGRPATRPAPQPGTEAPRGEAPRVEAVERALSILEAFADGTPRLSLAALAARTGLYPSTVLRLAGSLQRFGQLARGPDGMFRLGPATLRLGLLYRAGFDLAEHVRPALARLVAATGETAAFYVREGERRVCLYRHHAERLIRHHVEEGASLPLDRGAGGHVLLAHAGGRAPVHAAVRRQGWAISLGERDPEAAGIAAPVFGHDGACLGALGVVGSVTRFAAADRAALAGVLLAEAAALSRALGAPDNAGTGRAR